MTGTDLIKLEQGVDEQNQWFPYIFKILDQK